MLATSCCCWKRRKEKLHSAVRLNRSRSLDKVTLGQYTDLVLGDKFCGEYYSDGSGSHTMGNSLAPESLEGEKELHTIKKTESSASLKSSSSAKSSSSRRSKVTFTETNPEVHMIPPKSPPKPKRSRGPKTDCDLILREDESQAAFQFDLSQTAQVTSLEDLEKYNNNNNNNNNSNKKQSSRSKKKARTPEDVQEVTADVVRLSVVCFIQPNPARLTYISRVWSEVCSTATAPSDYQQHFYKILILENMKRLLVLTLAR